MKQCSTKKERKLLKLSQSGWGGRYHADVPPASPNMAATLSSVTPLRTSRKQRAAISPSDETPPSKKGADRPMPEADFPGLDLEVEVEQVSDETNNNNNSHAVTSRWDCAVPDCLEPT